MQIHYLSNCWGYIEVYWIHYKTKQIEALKNHLWPSQKQEILSTTSNVYFFNCLFPRVDLYSYVVFNSLLLVFISMKIVSRLVETTIYVSIKSFPWWFAICLEGIFKGFLPRIPPESSSLTTTSPLLCSIPRSLHKNKMLPQ